MGNSQYATYLYAGIATDILIFPKIFITPSFSSGIYTKRKSIELGFPLEFRSSIEASYRFKNFSRLGLMFSHISNGSLSKKNPGAECLIIFYMIPISLKQL